MTELGEFAMWMAYGMMGIGIFFGPIAKSVGRWIESKSGGGAPKRVRSWRAGWPNWRRCSSALLPVGFPPSGWPSWRSGWISPSGCCPSAVSRSGCADGRSHQGRHRLS